MARFTVSRVCAVEEVDATVRDIVRTKERDHVSASNEGQTVLINVVVAALPVMSDNFGDDRVLVTCILGNERRDL